MNNDHHPTDLEAKVSDHHHTIGDHGTVDHDTHHHHDPWYKRLVTYEGGIRKNTLSFLGGFAFGFYAAFPDTPVPKPAYVLLSSPIITSIYWFNMIKYVSNRITTPEGKVNLYRVHANRYREELDLQDPVSFQETLFILENPSTPKRIALNGARRATYWTTAGVVLGSGLGIATKALIEK